MTQEEPKTDLLADPDGKGVRGDARLIEMALRHRWPLNPEKAPLIVARLEKTAESGDDRESNSAAKVLVAMAKHNVEAASKLDELARLDGGKAT